MEENFIKQNKKWAIVVYVILAAGVSWYIGERLGHAVWRWTGWHLHGEIMLVCAVSLFLFLFQGAVKIPRNQTFSVLFRVLIWVSGIFTAYVVYLFLCLFPLDMVVFLEKLPLFHIRPVDFYNDVILASAASVCIVTVGMVHANHLKQIHCSVSMPMLKEPVRLVHLSDLHMGSVIGRRQIRRIVRKTNALHPDLVVITGDLFNHNDVRECAHPDDLAEILKSLESRYGTFAVVGNHDPSPDDSMLRRFLNAAKITLLNDEIKEIDPLILAGRTGNTLENRPPIRSWLHDAERHKPVILLDHYPDSIIEAEELHLPLLLAGHTHNGQYFPCNYLIRLRYRGAMRHGYFRIRHSKCIVSAGAGYFQIPIRVGTDSEVICVDLVPEAPFPSGQTK